MTWKKIEVVSYPSLRCDDFWFAFFIFTFFILFLNTTERQLGELRSQQRWMAPLQRPSSMLDGRQQGEAAASREAADCLFPESYYHPCCLKQLDSFISCIPPCRGESEICFAGVLSGWSHVLAGRWKRWRLAAACRRRLAVRVCHGKAGRLVLTLANSTLLRILDDGFLVLLYKIFLFPDGSSKAFEDFLVGFLYPHKRNKCRKKPVCPFVEMTCMFLL